MKIKIIDLLNKIANGEAVPKMIYYGAKTYHYNNHNHSYIHYNIMDKEEYLTTNYRIEQILNDEIEIIEEDKPIEKTSKIEKITTDLNYANNYSKNNVKINGKYLADKINEIIDKVNELEKEK